MITVMTDEVVLSNGMVWDGDAWYIQCGEHRYKVVYLEINNEPVMGQPVEFDTAAEPR